MRSHKRLLIVPIIMLFIIVFAGCQSNMNEPENSAEMVSTDSKSNVNDLDDLAKQVSAGMTYDEVCSLLGSEGVDIGYGAILYEWDLGNGKKLLAWFSNPKGIEDAVLPDELIVTESRIE